MIENGSKMFLGIAIADVSVAAAVGRSAEYFYSEADKRFVEAQNTPANVYVGGASHDDLVYQSKDAHDMGDVAGNAATIILMLAVLNTALAAKSLLSREN